MPGRKRRNPRKDAPSIPVHHRVPSFSTTLADARRAREQELRDIEQAGDAFIDTTPFHDAFERQNGLGYSPGSAAAFIPSGMHKLDIPGELTLEADVIRQVWLSELKAIKPKEKRDHLVEFFTRYGTALLVAGFLVAAGVLSLALHSYGLF